MSYFHFTRGKKIGVVVLSSLILVLVVLLNVNHFEALPDPFGELNHLGFQQDSTTPLNSDLDNSTNRQKKSDQSSQLSNFNPNNLDLNEWESVGFSTKQAAAIVKYHSNYGPFKTASDVQKIYVISDKKYKEIEPFMIFDELEEKAEVNVNTASSVELETIHGIGPYYAKIIIEYREKLGGFSSANQFNEIEGMKEESVITLSNNMIIRLADIKKININAVAKDKLKEHPYFKDWAVVTSIIKMRDIQQIKSLNFLVEEGLISEKEKERMIVYIDFS